MSLKENYDVIIIGAGASGLMCGLTAAQRGRTVLVIDSSNKIGKKILMSGGGRCNFTNLYVEPDNFLSKNPHFCKSALNRYTQWDFISLIEKHGIAYEERKHGQLFCLNSAKDILNMLLSECEQNKVTVQSHCKVEKIKPAKNLQDLNFSEFELTSNHGKYKCKSLVIASGALSIPTLGATGYGYEVAEQFGLSVLPRRAGLVPFMFNDTLKLICEKISGVSLNVEVSCNAQSFTEDMLFTHRGLSGPVILQISNYWQPGDEIFINLLPNFDFSKELIALKTAHAKSLLRTLLSNYLPKSLVFELQALFWSDLAERPIGEISNIKLEEIACKLHSWNLKPPATEGYRTAEVTIGGVDTDEISSQTMECKKHKGLYFIGEVVDVTGHLGGFNFQWAWSSGYAAGLFV
jgi:predicted Rossmann fold flavoprotein